MPSADGFSRWPSPPLSSAYAKILLSNGRLPNTTNLIFHVIFGVTLFIGALTRSERYHKGLVVFGSALFVVYIVVRPLRKMHRARVLCAPNNRIALTFFCGRS